MVVGCGSAGLGRGGRRRLFKVSAVTSARRLRCGLWLDAVLRRAGCLIGLRVFFGVFRGEG